jgi:hypothetical protein
VLHQSWGISARGERERERKEDVTRQEKIGARKKRRRDAKSAEEEFGTCRDDQTSSQPMIAQFALKFSSGPAKSGIYSGNTCGDVHKKNAV